MLNSRCEEAAIMNLVWSILLTVLRCDAEEIIDGRPFDSVDHPTPITPLNGKHLRLLGTPVSRFLIVIN